jgi:hypothetical protein
MEASARAGRRRKSHRRPGLCDDGKGVMMHGPTAVTDGIEIAPDDQTIAVR